MSAHAVPWSEQLATVHLPALAYNKQLIQQALSRSATRNVDLGQLIVLDPGLALGLFRAWYVVNPKAAAPPVAPSRILDLLGLDSLLSLLDMLPTLEDSYLGSVRSGLQGSYARAIHSACFARRLGRLANLRGRLQVEEDTLTALLQGLGEMLFWNYHPRILERLLTPLPARPELLEWNCLRRWGQSPAELGEQLARRWGLPEAVQRIQRHHASFQPESQLPLLAVHLTWSGWPDWQSDALETLVELGAPLTEEPVDQVRAVVHQAVAEAARLCHAMGLPHSGERLLLPAGLARLIPAPPARRMPRRRPVAVAPTPRNRALVPSPSEITVIRATPPLPPTEPPPVACAPAPIPLPLPPEPVTAVEPVAVQLVSSAVVSPHLQLQARLTQMLRDTRQQLGLDRVLFAMLTPDRLQLRARVVVEDSPSALGQWEVSLQSRNLFSLLVTRPHAVWLHPGNEAKYLPHIPPETVALLRLDGCFIASLWVRGKALGILYGDGKAAHLNHSQFERFKLQQRQIEIILGG